MFAAELAQDRVLGAGLDTFGKCADAQPFGQREDRGDDRLLLGVGVGAIVVIWLGQVGFTVPGMEEMAGKFNLPARLYPQVSVAGLLMGPLCVFLASLVSSIYPALRLHWLEPVDAMRAA